jgi:hypothetical protein
VAQMAHLMITNPTFRQQIIATQKQRLQTFLPDAVEVRLQKVLQQIQVTPKLEST